MLKALIQCVLVVAVWLAVAFAFPTLNWAQYLIVMLLWEANAYNILAGIVASKKQTFWLYDQMSFEIRLMRDDNKYHLRQIRDRLNDLK